MVPRGGRAASSAASSPGGSEGGLPHSGPRSEGLAGSTLPHEPALPCSAPTPPPHPPPGGLFSHCCAARTSGPWGGPRLGIWRGGRLEGACLCPQDEDREHGEVAGDRERAVNLGSYRWGCGGRRREASGEEGQHAGVRAGRARPEAALGSRSASSQPSARSSGQAGVKRCLRLGDSEVKWVARVSKASLTPRG